MSLDLTTPPDAAVEAPTPAPAARNGITRVCPECSEPFSPPAKGPGGHKRFCSTQCRTDWSAREKAEGAVIITIAKIWRQSRGTGDKGKLAFARLTEALDVMNARDGEAGRHRLNPNGPLGRYIDSVLADPYIDRVRR